MQADDAVGDTLLWNVHQHRLEAAVVIHALQLSARGLDVLNGLAVAEKWSYRAFDFNGAQYSVALHLELQDRKGQ